MPDKPTSPAGAAPDPAARRAPRSRAGTTRATAPTGPERVRFTLTPIPPNADVYLDNELQFRFGLEHTSLEVPWDGDHTIEFRSPCCFPRRVLVGPAQDRPGNDHIVARLAGKPAALT